ncbi:hypothetical protein ACERK3_02235 [Phycisphaerales bacterium AB-hyl4]|uniref:Transposase n=1 Tax=Natronomicrosphaera hydrolytica TaxID=3242702 RepID=A0ABV4U2N3_9BACT
MNANDTKTDEAREVEQLRRLVQAQAQRIAAIERRLERIGAKYGTIAIT